MVNMDKKELKKITKKVFEEYGFHKRGKYFYLDLDDVIICAGFVTFHNVTYLAYNFSVKAVHSENERKLNDMFSGYDSIEQVIYFNKDAQGYHKKEICCEQYTEEEYSQRLKELLHYYFDPYKKDALNFIKRCSEEIGLVHENEMTMIKIKTKEYLVRFLINGDGGDL